MREPDGGPGCEISSSAVPTASTTTSPVPTTRSIGCIWGDEVTAAFAHFARCRGDVDGAYQFVRPRGIEATEPKTAPYGMRQVDFHDPDGYGICLQWTAA